jgi:hypothetical protein
VYEFVHTYTYETNAPMPIVVIDGPTKIESEDFAVGESRLLYYTVTNLGVMTAFDVQLGISGESEFWSLEPLVSIESLDLAPQQSILVPMVLTRLEGGEENNLRLVPVDPSDLCIRYYIYGSKNKKGKKE